MYFGYLLFIFLYALAVENRAAARRVNIHRLANGLDEFEVLDDNNDSVCAETVKVKEFCRKHGGISIQKTRSCNNNEEALHCQCNSTKSTFLLHEERCVNNENVTRFLQAGGNPDCKFHLAVKKAHNIPHCDTSPVSTLPLDISDVRRFSLCTAHTSHNQIISCKIDVNNSLYNKAGRWRRLWRLDPSAQSAGVGEPSLESILQKLMSNATRYSGLIVSLQATCLVNSQLNVRLRGQPPYDELQSCLLLKISGSRSLPLKPHQLRFTQSNLNSDLSVNQNKTDSGIDRNTMVFSKVITQKPSTSTPTVETATGKIGTPMAGSGLLYTMLLYFLIGAFLGLLLPPISIYFLVQCAPDPLKNQRRLSRRRSTGNPTYERGIDTSLALMPITAVNLSGSPVSTISPYAHVYQPIIENTRPHSVNGFNNVYESLRGVRDHQDPRRVTYSVYQDLSRASRVTSSGSNYQTMFARVEIPTARSSSACNYVNVATANANPQCNHQTPRDTPKPQSATGNLDEKGCPMDETCGCSLTGRCQSVLSLIEEAGAFGSESDVCSLSSLRFDEEEDIAMEDDQKEMKTDSTGKDVLCEEDQQDVTVDLSEKTSECDTPCDDVHEGTSDTPRDDLHESTSDCRLSGLEIMIDSDCSEYDSALEEVMDHVDETETQSPSPRFYYVLEGP